MSAGRVLPAAIGVAFLAGAAFLGLLIVQLARKGGIAAVDARLAALAPWLFAFRLALIALAIRVWPWLTAAASRRWRWPPRRAAAVAALRWRVPLWFLAFEVAVVQNGLGRLWGSLE